jgi:SAM-dependent methyltransferase
MDRIFDAKEIEQYEAWLETPAGARYLEASCDLLDRVLDWRPGWRVLDVGCGVGAHLARLQERGMHVFGLEAGPVAARVAPARLGPKAEVRQGDAHDLPYEDNSFDAVILVNSLELMERRAQVLAEASRVATSRLCLISHNPLSVSGLRGWAPAPEHPLHRGRPLGLITLWRLVREVLGPVPQRWAAAQSWPRPAVGRRPWGSLAGLCAAVTPRLRTTPLVLETRGPKPARPAAVHGRVVVLHREK